MNDLPTDIPPLAAQAQAIADRYDFRLSCEPRTGALLRTLAAAKPGSRWQLERARERSGPRSCPWSGGQTQRGVGRRQ